MADSNNDKKLQLPADWLQEHGIREGDTIVLTGEEGRLVVKTEEQYQHSLGNSEN